MILVPSSLTLSPFRYPGGKSWLIPVIKSWLKTFEKKPKYFVEPFAGGANIGLYVLAHNLVDGLILVEKDHHVATVWKTILRNPEKLINQIRNFQPSLKNLKAKLTLEPQDKYTFAFQTLLKNRVSRGGVIANGAGILKKGEAGRGVFSRWYPETLIKRILRIHELSSKIAFIEGDGLQLLRSRYRFNRDAYFIDPPYSALGKNAGKRLYNHYDLDHLALFQIAQKLKSKFIITYEDSAEIENISRQHSFSCKTIFMKTSHHVRCRELVISKNLNWLRS